MKKIILLFCLVATQHFAICQTDIYHPFPEGAARWNVGETIEDFGSGIYSLLQSGDTTINNKSYKALKKVNGAPPNYQFEYVGALRQEIVQKQVHYLPANQSEEQLLYDFNMAVDDTLPGMLSLSQDGYPVYVTHIDSVLVGSSYRKRWWVSSCLDSEWHYIIEGIGSSSNPFLPVRDNCWSVGGSYPFTHCFEDPQTSFKFPQTNLNFACDTVSRTQETRLEIFAATPNPFTVSTDIEMGVWLNDATIAVYDFSGRSVLKLPNLTGDRFTLHRDSLPVGIYSVVISVNGKAWGLARLVAVD